MLVIDPDECIDCAVCIPECPVNAIYAEEDVPSAQSNLISINQQLAFGATAITRRKIPLASAETWKDIPGKAMLLESDSSNLVRGNLSAQAARYQDLAKSASLTPAEWDSTLKNSDPVIRLIVASRPDFKLDNARLDDGLRDANDAIRQLYVRKGNDLISEALIDNLLVDSSKIVRLEVVKSHAKKFTSKQFDIALNDQHEEVRLAVIQNPQFSPSKKQLLKVLSTESRFEIQAMLGRLNEKLAMVALKHPSSSVRSSAYRFESLKLSKEQIEEGLNDSDLTVKMAVIQRHDFKPTQPQFETIVKLSDPNLLEAISRKSTAHCLLNFLDLFDEATCALIIKFAKEIPADLIDRCLADTRYPIVLSALKKIGRKLTQRQLGICLRSNNHQVRSEAIAHYGVERLPPKFVIDCLRDSHEKIRAIVAGSPAIELDETQLEALLVDRSLRVRFVVASRSDFSPSVLQYSRGKSDKSVRIRELYSDRFRLSKGQVVDKYKQEAHASTAELHKLLNEISKLNTWTTRKYQLKDDLHSLLDLMKYTQFKVDGRNAWLSQFGEHKIIDVPQDKRGHLQSMRGKKAHLICLGHGRYSTILFAAKAVD